MKHLLWFCSQHGFGHAARSSAVLSALQKIRPDIRITLVTSVPDWFFRDNPTLSPVSIVPVECDVGLIQRNAFEIDFDATLSALQDIYPVSKKWITRLSQKVGPADAVLCDISPAGLAYAAALGIPAAMIENFSWPFLYRRYVKTTPEFESFCDYFDSLVQSARLRINIAPYCEEIPGAQVTGPVSRRAQEPPELTRKKLGVPDGAHMVLVTMGGIDTKTAVRMIDSAEAVHLVISGGTDSVVFERGITMIPHRSDFFHPDLVLASDVVIGKLGYSTVAEAAVAGKPLFYITRPDFEETGPLAGWVQTNLGAKEITLEHLKLGTWLETGFPDSPSPMENADIKVAKAVSTFVDSL